MTKMLEVRIGRDKGRWIQMMHYMQNSPETVFCVRCANKERAKATRNRLDSVTVRYPEKFPMVIAIRGNDVYISKTDRCREVKILDNI